MSTPQQTEPHDLVSYMQAIGRDMAEKYQRIRKRSSEDPGTAGDQGEEDWAALLRDFLPQGYQVVTKGRILSQSGQATPQVDVVVLKPSYPKGLLSEKYYLAAGVAAAFECKVTLRKNDLVKTFENARSVTQTLGIERSTARQIAKKNGRPTAYFDLHRPTIFGLLAHSCDLGIHKGEAERVKHISELLQEYHMTAKSPEELMDLLCIADLATWQMVKAPYTVRYDQLELSGNEPWIGATHNPQTCYTVHHASYWQENSKPALVTTPMGSLLSVLLQKLAQKDSKLAEIADYFGAVNAARHAGSRWRSWPQHTLCPDAKSFYEPLEGSNWMQDLFP